MAKPVTKIKAVFFDLEGVLTYGKDFTTLACERLDKEFEEKLDALSFNDRREIEDALKFIAKEALNGETITIDSFRTVPILLQGQQSARTLQKLLFPLLLTISAYFNSSSIIPSRTFESWCRRRCNLLAGERTARVRENFELFFRWAWHQSECKKFMRTIRDLIVEEGGKKLFSQIKNIPIDLPVKKETWALIQRILEEYDRILYKIIWKLFTTEKGITPAINFSTFLKIITPEIGIFLKRQNDVAIMSICNDLVKLKDSLAKLNPPIRRVVDQFIKDTFTLWCEEKYELRVAELYKKLMIAWDQNRTLTGEDVGAAVKLLADCFFTSKNKGWFLEIADEMKKHIRKDVQEVISLLKGARIGCFVVSNAYGIVVEDIAIELGIVKGNIFSTKVNFDEVDGLPMEAAFFVSCEKPVSDSLKTRAVENVMEKSGLQWTEVCVVGDSIIDRHMLSTVARKGGLSIGINVYGDALMGSKILISTDKEKDEGGSFGSVSYFITSWPNLPKDSQLKPFVDKGQSFGFASHIRWPEKYNALQGIYMEEVEPLCDPTEPTPLLWSPREINEIEKIFKKKKGWE